MFMQLDSTWNHVPVSVEKQTPISSGSAARSASASASGSEAI